MNQEEENFDQVQKLLRLKRYEQPRPGFHEDFLREFHSRQRAELIRRPLRQIVWERIQSMLPEFNVPGYAYGAAMAVFFGVAMVITQMDGEDPSQLGVVAEAVSAGADRTQLALNAEPSSVKISDLEEMHALASNSSAASRHYVLQAQPVSYERPVGF